MDKRQEQILEIENAVIGYRNFTGRPSDYNKEGERSFAVFFDDLELAQKLSDDGWNIKFPKQDPNSEFERKPYLQVGVRFKPIPCKVVMITDKTQVHLNERTVDQLDIVELATVDLVIRPYHYTVRTRNGVEEGIKAYLKAGYFVLDTNDAISRFESKYAHLLGNDDDDFELPFK